MVPYDQPEAALVRCQRASECVEMLSCPTCLGYDYPMGQECPSGELIRCIVSRVLNSMDINRNIRVSGTFSDFRTFLMPPRRFDGSALTRSEAHAIRPISGFLQTIAQLVRDRGSISGRLGVKAHDLARV